MVERVLLDISIFLDSTHHIQENQITLYKTTKGKQNLKEFRNYVLQLCIKLYIKTYNLQLR